MKKIILINLVLLLCFTTAIAQQHAICGDWIGIAHETALKEHPVTGNMMRVDEKLYIRIKQIDGKYQVRMKSQIADGSRPFYYLPKCVYEGEGKSQSFRIKGFFIVHPVYPDM